MINTSLFSKTYCTPGKGTNSDRPFNFLLFYISNNKIINNRELVNDGFVPRCKGNAPVSLAGVWMIWWDVLKGHFARTLLPGFTYTHSCDRCQSLKPLMSWSHLCPGAWTLAFNLMLRCMVNCTYSNALFYPLHGI